MLETRFGKCYGILYQTFSTTKEEYLKEEKTLFTFPFYWILPNSKIKFPIIGRNSFYPNQMIEFGDYKNRMIYPMFKSLKLTNDKINIMIKMGNLEKKYFFHVDFHLKKSKFTFEMNEVNFENFIVSNQENDVFGGTLGWDFIHNQSIFTHKGKIIQDFTEDNPLNIHDSFPWLYLNESEIIIGKLLKNNIKLMKCFYNSSFSTLKLSNQDNKFIKVLYIIEENIPNTFLIHPSLKEKFGFTNKFSSYLYIQIEDKFLIGDFKLMESDLSIIIINYQFLKTKIKEIYPSKIRMKVLDNKGRPYSIPIPLIPNYKVENSSLLIPFDEMEFKLSNFLLEILQSKSCYVNFPNYVKISTRVNGSYFPVKLF